MLNSKSKVAGQCCGFLPLLLMLGCGQTPCQPPEEDDRPCADLASRFDPTTTGTIHGRVRWEDPLLVVEPFTILPVAIGIGPPHGKMVRENPNAPLIDPDNRGVGNAVVFLRGIDPQRSRPWDHPPVQVEMKDYRLHIRQLPQPPLQGFVRRGESIEMVSREPVFHMMHADGADFFTLAFPDPDQPSSRRLRSKGVVELSSAANYFWMRAYLFVDDHPYYTCTTANGHFELADVPPGEYEVVCWMPNWMEAKRDLDPESAIVLRLRYQPPVEIRQRVTVKPQQANEVQFTVSSKAFQ